MPPPSPAALHCAAVIRLCCLIMRIALVAGATGLVGSQCVELLLARPDVERVHILAC
jgi:hypothetical protein